MDCNYNHDSESQEIQKLRQWITELEQGKEWLSNQNQQLINENKMLHDWTQEQDKAKSWLLEKISVLEKENNSLWSYIKQNTHSTKKSFHHIISLGYNCEVSFRIKDYYGKLDSTIYSWCYIKSRTDFLRSLDNPLLLANDKKVLNSNGMFQCLNYDITFHTKVDGAKLFHKKERVRHQAEKEANAEMKSRYSYLAEKFVQFLENQDEDILFIIKMQPWEKDLKENQAFLRNLRDKLFKLCATDHFRILVVLEKKADNLNLLLLEDDLLYIRFVDCYASDDETKQGGDINGWNSILHEFSLINKNNTQN